MTTAPHMSASSFAARPSYASEQARDAAGVRWDISPVALVAAAPGRALLNGHAATLTRAALEISIAPGGRISAELVVTMRDGSVDRIPMELPPVVISRASDPSPRGGSIEHLDAPGVLHLTLHTGAGASPCIAYAATPLLQSVLGLAGGVYDQPTIVLR